MDPSLADKLVLLVDPPDLLGGELLSKVPLVVAVMLGKPQLALAVTHLRLSLEERGTKVFDLLEVLELGIAELMGPGFL